jgi:hypothetical protein
VKIGQNRGKSDEFDAPEIQTLPFESTEALFD